VWIPDTLAVLQQLDEMNDPVFGGRLELDRLGFIGHSFGGGVAAETCRILAERCAGAVNLDGRHPDRLRELGMPAPYLYIAAEGSGSAAAEEVRAVVEHPLDEAALIEIAGAAHPGFTDGIWLMDAQGRLDDAAREAYGEIDPARMTELVRRYTLAFFDRTVRGADAPTLAELAESDPEVTVETFTSDR
jgi:pimeloyl-ACP methyl ester carboxylesterase